MCYYYGQKHFPIPYQTGRDIAYLVVAFGLSYAGFFLHLGNPILDFIAKNSLVMLFLAWVAFREKDLLNAVLQRRKSA
jgi:hypothetical protein